MVREEKIGEIQNYNNWFVRFFKQYIPWLAGWHSGYVDKAKEAYQRGEYLPAFGYLFNALNIDPAYARAWLEGGRIHFIQSQYQQALDCLTRVTLNKNDKHLVPDLDQENSKVFWQIKSEVLFYLGKYREALDAIKKLEKFGELDVSFLLLKGKIFEFLNESDSALRCFDKALSEDEHCEEAKNKKAFILIKLQRYDDVLNIESADYRVLFEKGKILLNQQKYEMALAFFNSAIEKNDQAHEVKIYKSYTLFCLQRDDEANLMLDELEIILHSTNLETELVLWAWIIKGQIFLKQRNYNSALDYFKKALKLKGDHKEGLQLKAQTLHAMDKYVEALQEVDKVLILEPQNVFYLDMKGQLLLAQNQYEAALACFEQALVVQTNRKSSLVNKARVLGAVGQCQKAHETIDKALTFYRDDMECLEIKVKLFLWQNLYEKALEWLSRINEKSVGIYLDNAQINLNVGDYKTTHQILDQVLKVEPRNVFAFFLKGLTFLLEPSYLHLDKYQSAFGQFDTISNVRTNTLEELVGQGFVSIAQQEWNNAKRCFQKAEKFLPLVSNYYKAFVLLGLATIRAHDNLESDKYFQEAEQLCGDIIQCEILALCYSALESYEKAIEIYQKILRIFPEHQQAQNKMQQMEKFIHSKDKQPMPSTEQHTAHFLYVRLMQLIKETEGLWEENTVLQQSLEEKQIELEANKKKYDEEIQKLNKLIHHQEEVNSAKQKREEALSDENLKLIDQNRELEKRVLYVKSEKDTLNIQISSLGQQVKDQKTTVERLNIKNQKLAKDIQHYQNEIVKLMSTITEKNQRITELESGSSRNSSRTRLLNWINPSRNNDTSSVTSVSPPSNENSSPQLNS